MMARRIAIAMAEVAGWRNVSSPREKSCTVRMYRHAEKARAPTPATISAVPNHKESPSVLCGSAMLGT